MRVWYSPAGHVLGTLSSRLGVVVGGDAVGSAGVKGGVGAIACRCCPRMSWHSKNAAVTAHCSHGCVAVVVCDVYFLIAECDSALELLAPCVDCITVFEHEGEL